MINEGINNHPFKKFGSEDQKVVGILVEAHGTEQGSFLGVMSCKGNVETQPLSRSMF